VSARLMIVRSTARPLGKKVPYAAASVMVIETACNNSNLFFFFSKSSRRFISFPLRRFLWWKGKKSEALTCAM
jgi:hypothetical protein